MKNLCAMAQKLKDLGYKVRNISNLKPKHVDALFDTWKTEGLSIGTVKNRMAHVRFWAESVGKSSILKTNKDYGLENRTMHNGDKSQRLDMDKLQTVDEKHVQMSLRLQSAFGLRREEAMKFTPSLADKGDYITLKASWG
jgi:hypothetical protein